MLRLQGIGGVRTERGDLLAVLDQLDSDTLSDSLYRNMLVLADGEWGDRMKCFRGDRSTYGVRLLGLNTDLLEDDSLGVGRTTEGAVLSIPPC